MKLTIDKKVCFFISLMILVFGTLIGLYAIRDETEHMHQILDEHTSVLLNNLAYNLEYPVLVRDSKAISRLAKGVLAQKGIVSCRVEGNAGLLLYQERKTGDDEEREFAVPIITGKAGGEEALIVGAQQEVSEEVGKVTLTVSLAELHRKITRLRTTITILVLAVILPVSLGTYLLLRYLVGSPVAQLVHATERIAQGDLLHKVSLATRDEFELLGDSFDRMTDTLREAQEELLQREKLAALGQLAGGVGNELRNPLGVMRNAVFFLRNVLPDASEQAKEYLGIIDSEIDNSHRIISDFVDFFRTKKPQAKVVAVREFIDQGVGLSAIPDSVSLVVEVMPGLPAVYVDPSQLRQTIQNLIANAVQAMPHGGSLRIGARLMPATEAQVPRVEISVADTGAGISAANLEKLFQPLFTTKSRGIGLGLAICKSFVEANNGRIEVHSELEKGTTFTVILPAEEKGG